MMIIINTIFVIVDVICESMKSLNLTSSKDFMQILNMMG